MPKMTEHGCQLSKEELGDELSVGKFQEMLLISSDNPHHLGSFRSRQSIFEEKLRHLKVNKYTIHPFSKFKAWYDVYLIYLYMSVLITKPVDAGFMKARTATQMMFYKPYTVFTDVLCWIDICMNFMIGFELSHSKFIELRPLYIARHYAFSQLFICDLLSSIPKSLCYVDIADWSDVSLILGIVSIAGLFKIVRLVSLLRCIGRTAEYFKFKSRGVLFLLYAIIVILLTVHWVACMQFAIPKFFRVYFGKDPEEKSWFFVNKGQGKLHDKPFIIQYIHSFFKGTAGILGIRVELYDLETPEEYILTITTFFMGKIMMAFIWIILAVAILNSRLMDIKYAEVINQLEEYMRQKQLPLSLRDRISDYFRFKYRGRYFQESLITGLLSDNLRKETNLHVRRSLLRNVSLFGDMTILEMSKVVDFLIPEIYLPNDTIIHAGAHGDSMYFISSGTVAVYTRSGKEVCHLQDGAFFGEISIILKGQLRLTTIIALETTQIYKLKKKDLELYLLSNKQVLNRILIMAERRLKETTRIEEEYKEQLFEQSHRKIDSTN